MRKITVSRRNLLTTGACALAGAVSLPVSASAGEQNAENEQLIRRWYAGWEKKDWGPLDRMLADDFTFSSPNGDDHISKATFKSRCWESNIDFIKKIDLERVTTGTDDAFVKYLCHTKNGKSFRNVEYLRLRNGTLESIECYFGSESSFPSAVSNRKT